MRQAEKDAFTLVELLIVIIIIGILATIAVPQYQKMVNKAKVIPELGNLIKAINMLCASTGEKYLHTPEGNVNTLDGWKSSGTGLVANDGTYPDWAGPYIEGQDDIFLDPWGSAYDYDGPGNATEMRAGESSIISRGPNKRRETLYYDPNKEIKGDDIGFFIF